MIELPLIRLSWWSYVFFRAVETSLSVGISGPPQEQDYIFLKKMVQILVELGSQLCSVWNSKDTKMQTRTPENFATYLQAMLEFSRYSHSHTCVHTVTNKQKIITR